MPAKKSAKKTKRRKPEPIWEEIRAAAAEVLEKHRARPRIAADVIVLLNSMGDTLSKAQVLKELKELGKSRALFDVVIASKRKAKSG